MLWKRAPINSPIALPLYGAAACRVVFVKNASRLVSEANVPLDCQASISTNELHGSVLGRGGGRCPVNRSYQSSVFPRLTLEVNCLFSFATRSHRTHFAVSLRFVARPESAEKRLRSRATKKLIRIALVFSSVK